MILQNEVNVSNEFESVVSLDEGQIKKLSNLVLMDQTFMLVKEERRIGVGILNRLREISCRKLHLELGYSSLFSFVVGDLKYPEATAYRLVNAMQLMLVLPEVEEKIKQGSLSVSTASQVQSYIKAQSRENAVQFAIKEKKEILQAVEGQSSRMTEKILASFHPAHPLKSAEEKVCPVANDQTIIQFVASDDLMKKLSRIKDLTAHQNWNPSYAELFQKLAEFYLEKNDPLLKAERQKQREKKDESSCREEQLKNTDAVNELPTLEVKINKQTRYIEAKVRREVLINDQFQCTFVSKITGKRCGETKGLQLDHSLPFALGGSNQSTNLKTLCASHNRWAGEKIFGKRGHSFS